MRGAAQPLEQFGIMLAIDSEKESVMDKNKIVEDLKKSGFASELQAIRTCLSANWKCTGFATYFDKDQESIRSVDLRAWMERTVKLSDETHLDISIHIDADVKKSENPWVVFKEAHNRVRDNYSQNLCYISGLPPFSLRDVFPQHSIHTNSGWVGYSVHESFKKPNESARSYAAFITVCKAAEATLQQNSAFYKEENQESKKLGIPLHNKAVILSKPVVILDGELLTASVSDEGAILVEEVKFAPLSFVFKSKHCEKGIYTLDIVTLNNLQEYLSLSEKRMNEIFEVMKTKIERKITLNG
jgi:hypothetical protein